MEYINEAIKYLKLQANDSGEAEKYLRQFQELERAKLLITVKKILVIIAVQNGANMSGKCYECKYRECVPGDAHSCCTNRFAVVKGDKHGIESGWFFHPYNFDPVWLVYCDGFEEK